MANVRICMIGAGRVGKLHSGTLRRHVPGGELVALVDPFQKVLDETGDQFEIDRRFSSLEQALEAVDFDAVVITTPTPTHRDLAVLAAEQGKHVFLEKPMALTLAECDDIMSATARHGVILQMGFMRRFDPDFAAAWERIQAGEIGEVMIIKSLTHGPGLPPPWATDLKTSNGNLAEVNSHDLDTARWLSASTPLRMYVEVANFKGAERGVTSDHYYDNMFATVKFESGAMASISGVCPCDYGYDSRVEIVGKKGIMQIGELKGESIVVGIDRDQGLVTPIFRRWPDRFRWGYIRELEHFVDCVHAERRPIVTGEDGRWAVAMVLAGTRSFLEERPVYLQEVITSNG
ncbi:MAG: Gfo/Idh/MocA family oxidoreductase [Anaerolineae bacterium]|uniref:Gfo/Idh/MocA family oxidoreductase n=1 Tax=Promineifilum sp. TaxID=2664178 RepID=UPI001DF657CC|nr:Gfo/Idh/MocA family oxidoreductase [Anaerolineales bacterium]MCB8935831.1 Gfo/Idh/MocA family oxidoreductase [Promineifilum sp.]MCO5180452.1 Gfo/Idh/MocA family oxidoreductase [Promineifilum sp.]MCW5847392.1 Gfo/Idh/MocA family oxidoreductase [Anaerolineae bacterium]